VGKYHGVLLTEKAERSAKHSDSHEEQLPENGFAKQVINKCLHDKIGGVYSYVAYSKHFTRTGR